MDIFKDVKKYDNENDITDNDFDEAFTKIASDGVKSFNELEEKVKTTFNENPSVMLKFAKWLDKLALDRNKLLEVSKTFGK